MKFSSAIITLGLSYCRVALTKLMALSACVSMCIILTIAYAATSAIDCPQMCDCQQSNDNSLTVDCGGHGANETILVQELDLLLSDDGLRENLTSVKVSNTSLTQVPVSYTHLTLPTNREV